MATQNKNSASSYLSIAYVGPGAVQRPSYKVSHLIVRQVIIFIDFYQRKKKSSLASFSNFAKVS